MEPDNPRQIHPEIANAVARNQMRPGATDLNRNSNIPANTGAEPIATMVPTATPVRDTPQKKQSWYVATKTPAAAAIFNLTSLNEAGSLTPA
jgi:hypothetical protein